jgi:serine phosphatase RsbU (regulator of sigma subunit)
MKIKKHIIFIILFFVNSFIFSQNNYETEVLEHYAKAENFYTNNKITDAIDEINKAIEILPNITSNTIKGQVNLTAGIIFSNNKQNIIALKFFIRAIDNYEKNNDSLLLSNINQRIATIYFELKAYYKTIEYIDKALNYRPIKDFDVSFEIDCKEIKANCYFNNKNYEKAENLYEELYIWYSTKKQDEKAIIALKNITITLEKQKKYEKAIENHKKLYGIFIVLQRPNKATEALNNIGYNYVLLKNYEEAKKSFLFAEKNLNKGVYSKDFVATLYTNIGICYQNTNDYINAIDYLIKALKIREDEKNNKEIAEINNILALTYYRNNDLYNAAEYSLESIEYAKKTNNKELLSLCFKTYSIILQATEDHQKALDYYKQYLLIQDSILRSEKQKREELDEKILELEKSEKELKLKIAEENVKDILLEQLDLKAKQKEQENAILKKEYELQESEKQRIQQSLVLIKQQNDALLKNKEIEKLEQEKILKDNELKLKEAQEKEQEKAYELLKSEKEKQTLELQKQELSLEKQAEREKRYAWMMILAIVITALIIIYSIQTKKKNNILSIQKSQIEQKNVELSQQNDEIMVQKENLEMANTQIMIQSNQLETKNREITDSIKYAQRIQTAVLPPFGLISHKISDYFILYKPKDIVSGDFYWFKEFENHLVVAVADCTGHGVPGAFMSMLGISFLNEIVKPNNLNNAALILDELRNKVKEALRQNDKYASQQDGMDISFYILNFENMKMQFAGANNPIIIIKNNEILQIKGDKMPVGVYLNERPFTNHEIMIEKNDIIYSFTDGYYDQIGGPDGKKIFSKNFANLLFKNHKEKLSNQQELLDKHFIDWINTTNTTNKIFSQLDDILVIGVKI